MAKSETVINIGEDKNTDSKKARLLLSNPIKDCFENLLKSQDIAHSTAQYKNILKQFGINDEEYLQVYIEIFTHFTCHWPGLEEKRQAYKQLDSPIIPALWFEEYCSFIKSKLHYVSENKSMFVGHEVNNTSSDQIRPESKYRIQIKGPPHYLNSLVFTTEGTMCSDHVHLSPDNLIVKRHLPKKWINLVLKQLINYPSVVVQLAIGDLSFTRANADVNDYERYVQINNDSVTIQPPEKVYSVTKIKDNVQVEVFTYNYFKAYIKQLKQVLPEATARTADICTILDEFLKDIEDVNMYGNKVFASNTTVVFSLGSSKYIRSKKLHSTGKLVTLCEILTPRISLSLDRFDAVQDLDDTSRVSFITLNKYQTTTPNFAVTLKYCCHTCKDQYSDYKKLIAHLKNVHYTEESVICPKCIQITRVIDLAGNRWNHICATKTTTKS